jgi:hypothetical protein
VLTEKVLVNINDDLQAIVKILYGTVKVKLVQNREHETRTVRLYKVPENEKIPAVKMSFGDLGNKIKSVAEQIWMRK